MDVADVVDGSADRVQQRRHAAHIIGVRVERFDLVDRQAVVHHFMPVVEEHRRPKRFAAFLFLFLQGGIKAADRIRLQAAHRTAAVDDEHHFHEILISFFDRHFFRHVYILHFFPLLLFLRFYCHFFRLIFRHRFRLPGPGFLHRFFDPFTNFHRWSPFFQRLRSSLRA